MTTTVAPYRESEYARKTIVSQLPVPDYVGDSFNVMEAVYKEYGSTTGEGFDVRQIDPSPRVNQDEFRLLRDEVARFNLRYGIRSSASAPEPLRSLPGLLGYLSCKRQLSQPQRSPKTVAGRALHSRLCSDLELAGSPQKRLVCYSHYIKCALRAYYTFKESRLTMPRRERCERRELLRHIIAGLHEERDLFLAGPVIADAYRGCRYTILADGAGVVCGPLGSTIHLQGYVSDDN
ncbi:unnamed protein product [Peniophora sp. CBMAI 1063]|nr:unnamed protein product [Peniophora sp. CBMAI 1063]